MSDAAQEAVDAIREVNDMAGLKAVSDALKAQWKRVQQRQVTAFAPGDKVRATADAGKYAGMLGHVLRVNQKTVSVEPANADEAHACGLRPGGYVRFSPTYLEPAG
jgi:transcription antitermination factor NusG